MSVHSVVLPSWLTLSSGALQHLSLDDQSGFNAKYSWLLLDFIINSIKEKSCRVK